DEELDAEGIHAGDVIGETIGAGAREERRLRRARVPPLRETALRVGVDERHRPRAGAVRLDREVTREGGLAGPALLGCDGDNVHFDSPGEPDSVEVEVTRESWNRVELTLGILPNSRVTAAS